MGVVAEKKIFPKMMIETTTTEESFFSICHKQFASAQW
jgi:hypothetical protein